MVADGVVQQRPIIIGETVELNGYVFHGEDIAFDKNTNIFYRALKDGRGDAAGVLSEIPTGSGTIDLSTHSIAELGTKTHSLLTGLSGDDHTQYHTDSRALTWLGTRSTSDLPEGSHLYYTSDRWNTAFGSANLTGLGTRLHSSLQNLTTGDDHTQYALLAGRSGGQTLIGDTASGGSLWLQSTAHATKGRIRSTDPLVVGLTTASASLIASEFPLKGVAHADDVQARLDCIWTGTYAAGEKGGIFFHHITSTGHLESIASLRYATEAGAGDRYGVLYGLVDLNGVTTEVWRCESHAQLRDEGGVDHGLAFKVQRRNDGIISGNPMLYLDFEHQYAGVGISDSGPEDEWQVQRNHNGDVLMGAMNRYEMNGIVASNGIMAGLYAEVSCPAGQRAGSLFINAYSGNNSNTYLAGKSLLQAVDHSKGWIIGCDAIDYDGKMFVICTGADPVDYSTHERLWITDDGYVGIHSPSSSPDDADLNASDFVSYLDVTNNVLKVRVKYPDGSTLKTGSISLS